MLLNSISCVCKSTWKTGFHYLSFYCKPLHYGMALALALRPWPWPWPCSLAFLTSLEFLKTNCNRERAGMLLTEIWETCNTDQRHETSRLNIHVLKRMYYHCGWNGRLAKPQRPETNKSFNTPDTQRNTSNNIVRFKEASAHERQRGVPS